MKKTTATLLILLTCSLLALHAQIKFPFPGSKLTNRQGQPVAGRMVSQKQPAARLTGADTIGFGGEPGVVWERELSKLYPGNSSYYLLNNNKLVDGNFLASGYIEDSNGNSKMVYVKFDKHGNVLLKANSPDGEVYHQFIYPSNDTGWFTIMDTLVKINNENAYTRVLKKYNKNGERKWSRKIIDSVLSESESVICLNDGSIMVAYLDDRNGKVISCGTGTSNTYFDRISLMKLDSVGNEVWHKGLFQQDYFRFFSFEKINISKTKGGYFITGNYSRQNKDSSACWNYNHLNADFFVAKIDEEANPVFLKFYGGSDDDQYIGGITTAVDSGIVLFGATRSVDGDLSGVNANSTLYNSWAVGVNDTGKIVLNKSFRHPNNQNQGIISVVQLHDSSFVFSIVYGYYGLDGGLEKIKRDGSVSWSVKQWKPGSLFLQNDLDEIVYTRYIDSETEGYFGKLGPVSQISGSVFYDFNKNGIKESNEPYCKNFQAITTKPDYSRSSFSQNGWLRNDVDTGTYTTTIVTDKPYYTIVPASKQTSFATLGLSDTVHFALQPIDGKQDLSVSVMPLTAARPGFNASYKINYRNAGTTTITNAQLKFVKDARTTFVSGSLAPTQTTADTILWDIPSFTPLADSVITIQLKLASPATLSNGDTLKHNVFILPVNGDLSPTDDTASIKQLVTGSYDPNDKSENFVGKMPEARYALGDEVQYLIRFQNTGTDTAFNVNIADTLDANLDWSTLHMIGSSHKYKMTITNGNKVQWMFDNINLPDSNKNEPLSHGFISFKIRPKSNLTAGDYIQNKAFIYFDYNLPVPTNTVTTTIISNRLTPVSVVNADDIKITVMPNPGKSNVYMLLTGNIKGKLEVSMIDNTGRTISKQTIQRTTVSEATYLPLQVDRLLPGVYYIKAQQGNKSWVQKMVIIQ